MKVACSGFPVVFLLGLGLPAAGEITAFKDVNLVPMTTNRVTPSQTVIVSNGKIREIGPSREVSTPACAAVIDGAGKYLMPGLADMHTHLNDGMFEYPFFNLFLANGVTTIRDLTQGSPPSVLKYRREIEASKRLGPNVLVAYTIWGNERDIAGRMTGVNDFGTIEVGKRADLLLLEMNPLEKVGNVRNPLGVVVRDRWLPRDTLQALLTVKTTKTADLLAKAYAQGGIEAAMNSYSQIMNDDFNNKYYYCAATLNQIGYELLAADSIDDALRVFQLNAEEYPEDWNCFDSYGEALMKAGKKDLAIESYERAIALDPSKENPRNMLRQVRALKE